MQKVAGSVLVTRNGNSLFLIHILRLDSAHRSGTTTFLKALVQGRTVYTNGRLEWPSSGQRQPELGSGCCHFSLPSSHSTTWVKSPSTKHHQSPCSAGQIQRLCSRSSTRIFNTLGKWKFASLPCNIPGTWWGWALGSGLEQWLRSTGVALLASAHAQTPEEATDSHLQVVRTIFPVPFNLP